MNWQKNINALSKIRPWYGHDAHMHIRLKCPMNNADCINQNPPMLNHGCTGNDIDWWFTQEAISYYNKKPSEQAKRFNDIPEKCQKLYLRIKQGFLKNYQSSD